MPTLVFLPQASQSVTGSGGVSRTATCPEHESTSRRFRGVQAAGWVFTCRGPKEHNFIARPDPTSPTTVEKAKELLPHA